MTEEIREKLSLFCSVPREAVIEEMDVAHSIFELPHMLKKEGLDKLVTQFLGLDAPAPKTGRMGRGRSSTAQPKAQGSGGHGSEIYGSSRILTCR